MIVYVSVRPLIINGQRITPRDHLRHGFSELRLSLLGFKCLAFAPENDGRMLYEVTIPDGLTQNQLTALRSHLSLGLSAWGPSVETVASATTLINNITGQTWTNNGTVLIPPVGSDVKI